MGGKDDVLFQSANSVSDFGFDIDVVEVFDNMVNRSVPFYSAVQDLFVDFGKTFYKSGTVIYDIGCALAETSLRLADALSGECRIIGVDSSAAMVEAARKRVAEAGRDNCIEVRLGSAADDLPAHSASVAVLSLTLQFVRPVERERVMRNIANSLQPGGALLLFEKIVVSSPRINRLFIDEYYEYKAKMGYSEDEIWRKRLSLENVLIPYTIEENLDLLRNAGLSEAEPMFQWMNFAAFLAHK
jgi:tRNA (cmo5U34)-methyltransferase